MEIILQTDDWLPSRKQGRPPCPAATERRAAVVPPVKGSTMGYVGVYWDRSTRVWKAEYKPAKEARKKYLGSYATDQLAARARYDHIRDKGLEQFNTMDVLDTATDLMVPRERMLSFGLARTPPPRNAPPPPREPLSSALL